MPLQTVTPVTTGKSMKSVSVVCGCHLWQRKKTHACCFRRFADFVSVTSTPRRAGVPPEVTLFFLNLIVQMPTDSLDWSTIPIRDDVPLEVTLFYLKLMGNSASDSASDCSASSSVTNETTPRHSERDLPSNINVQDTDTPNEQNVMNTANTNTEQTDRSVSMSSTRVSLPVYIYTRSWVSAASVRGLDMYHKEAQTTDSVLNHVPVPVPFLEQELVSLARPGGLWGPGPVTTWERLTRMSVLERNLTRRWGNQVSGVPSIPPDPEEWMLSESVREPTVTTKRKREIPTSPPPAMPLTSLPTRLPSPTSSLSSSPSPPPPPPPPVDVPSLELELLGNAAVRGPSHRGRNRTIPTRTDDDEYLLSDAVREFEIELVFGTGVNIPVIELELLANAGERMRPASCNQTYDPDEWLLTAAAIHG